MAGYTLVNLKDVEDQAPKFGYSPGLESRFARKPLELEHSGLAYFRIASNFRTPFGHKHSEQEEVYLIVDGNARLKLDDDILELKQWDVVRIPPGVMRCLEGGPDGAEVIAYGAPSNENRDIEMVPDWW